MSLLTGLFINLTPFKHPEKSSIFLGTRFVPLSFKGEGGEFFRRRVSPFLNILNFPPL
jgi:hypothetical protein